MQGCDDIRNMCVFSGKMLLFILCLTMIDPPNHHGHLRAPNPVVSMFTFHKFYIVLLYNYEKPNQITFPTRSPSIQNWETIPCTKVSTWMKHYDIVSCHQFIEPLLTPPSACHVARFDGYLALFLPDRRLGT